MDAKPRWFRRWRRSLGILGCLLGGLALLGGCALGLPYFKARNLRYQAAADPNGGLRLVDGLAVAVFAGTPVELGQAQARLVGPQAKLMLNLMGMQPNLLLDRQRLRDSLLAIQPEDRAEIEAFAAAAGIEADRLLAANALVDTQCSALVSAASASAPLAVARNMDFFPAGVLGPATLLSVVRREGCRAYANVGWPGGVGVVSGMNDAGLVTCVLLNHHGDRLPAAEPLTLRLRSILLHEADVAGAVRRFAAAPVASSHYVLLADSATACVVWQGRDGLHRDDLAGGWLAASNGKRVEGQPDDDRGRRLRQRAAEAGARPGDRGWMRQSLSCSYMRGINAQAMLFVPALRRCELALGTGTKAAAYQPWRGFDLGGILAGGELADLTCERLPAEQPLPHYSRR